MRAASAQGPQHKYASGPLRARCNTGPAGGRRRRTRARRARYPHARRHTFSHGRARARVCGTCTQNSEYYASSSCRALGLVCLGQSLTLERAVSGRGKGPASDDLTNRLLKDGSKPAAAGARPLSAPPVCTSPWELRCRSPPWHQTPFAQKRRRATPAAQIRPCHDSPSVAGSIGTANALHCNRRFAA